MWEARLHLLRLRIILVLGSVLVLDLLSQLCQGQLRVLRLVSNRKFTPTTAISIGKNTSKWVENGRGDEYFQEEDDTIWGGVEEENLQLL